MKLFAALITLLFFGLFTANAQIWMDDLSEKEKVNFNSVIESFDQYWLDKEPAKGSGWKQFKRWEDFWESRVDENGNFPDGLMIKRKWENYLKSQKGNTIQAEKADWRQRGPIQIPENILSYQSSGLGRINTVAFHPTNPNLFWIGAASGGAWYTEDGGRSWTGVPITQFLNIGVSDIAIAESNPNIIYIATGDANGISMTRDYSIGVIKSIDGGKTWNETQLSKDLSERILCARLLIDPVNPDRVFAATNKGIYRTLDGGSNWELKTKSVYFRDMEFNPENADIIYASTYTGQAYTITSTDGGDNWTENRDFINANRISLAVSKGDPDRVYAIASLQGSSKFLGMYISEDDGFSWEIQANEPNLFGINLSGSSSYNLGWYAMAFAVSNNYPDVIHSGCINNWRSSNGGKNWEAIAHWQGKNGLSYVHADNHFYAFQPGTDHLFACNDGGIYKSTDYGETWEDLSSGLPIAQIYKLGVSQLDNAVITGMQDNGSNYMKDGYWTHVYGADGMDCHIDYSNPDIVYCSYQNGALFKIQNNFKNYRSMLSRTYTQENAAWVTPYVIDPIDPDILYAGYVNMWKSEDQGDSWEKVSDFVGNPIREVAVSPSDNNYVYFVRDKIVYRSTNAGGSWSPHKQFASGVTDIEIDPNDPVRYWVTMSNYSANNKVIEVNGEEEIDLSQNLPEVPINSIVYYKGTEDKIYVGSDLGVFYRDKFMDQWEMFNQGMPQILVNDLEIKYDTKELFAGTFARGVWSTFIQDCEIDEPILVIDGDLELCKGESISIEVENEYSSYLWSTGLTENNITITESGTYFVIVKDEEGCTAYSEEIKVIVYDIPVEALHISQYPPYCEGDTVLVSVDEMIESITWSNNSTDLELKLSETATLSYVAYTFEGCRLEGNDIEFIFQPRPDKPSISREKNVLTSTPASRYQWYRDDILLPGRVMQSLTINTPGVYHVVVFNDADCGTESDKLNVISSVEIDDSFLTISPNPFTDKLRIVFEDEKFPNEVIISDILGRIVYSQSLGNSGNYIELDLGDLPNGSYFLKLIFGNEYIQEHLVKE